VFFSGIGKVKVHFTISRFHAVIENGVEVQLYQFMILWKYVEMKCQLDATEVSIADLIACSTCFGHDYAHHQELKSIIQWLLRVVFCAVVFQVAGLVWS